MIKKVEKRTRLARPGGAGVQPASRGARRVVAESGTAAAVVGEALVHVLLAVGAGPVRQITAAGVSIVPRVDAAAIVLAWVRQARVVPTTARAQSRHSARVHSHGTNARVVMSGSDPFIVTVWPKTQTRIPRAANRIVAQGIAAAPIIVLALVDVDVAVVPRPAGVASATTRAAG